MDEQIKLSEDLIQPDSSADGIQTAPIDVQDMSEMAVEIHDLTELEDYMYECEVTSENVPGKNMSFCLSFPFI